MADTNDVKYSDRVWCTLLWELMRHVEQRLMDTNDLGKALELAQQSGFLSMDPSDAAQLNNPMVIRLIHAVAPGLCLNFLRENAALLDPDAVIEWVRLRQPQYPDDQIMIDETS